MSTSVPITLRLGNRQYKIKVPQHQEETVRRCLQQIQETSQRLKKDFPGRDEQDYLAMTLIDFVTSMETPAEVKETGPGDEELIRRLQQLSTLFDS